MQSIECGKASFQGLTLLMEKTFIECVRRLPRVQASSPPAMAFLVASVRGMVMMMMMMMTIQA